RSGRPHPPNLIDHSLRCHRLANRNRMNPDVVFACRRSVKPHPLRKVGKVLPPHEPEHEKEGQGDDEYEVEKYLVEQEHARMIIALMSVRGLRGPSPSRASAQARDDGR